MWFTDLTHISAKDRMEFKMTLFMGLKMCKWLAINVKLKWRHDNLEDIDLFCNHSLIILNNEMKENPHILFGDDSNIQQ